jgi:phosphopantothenate-cysteine ligase
MYYLAAAVSDFYVPSQKTPEHKIQSGKGSLVIEMDQVPKVLRPMVQQWAPEGFIVSFKLETDEDLLIPKARAALERYGHQVVIGNNLVRRKYEVVFVERKESGSFQETWLRQGAEENERGEREIEKDIVRELTDRHDKWIRHV